MFKEIGKFAEQNNMIGRGDRIVAGISGGADSVCLLLFLNSIKEEYSLELFAVHVNHGVRGAEAKRDEEFTVALCERLKIPCRVFSVDVPAAAKLSGRSEEEEGRAARYAAFEEECERLSCSKIAVAHNQDDNAETVLHNLVRGSGLHGLCGIRPVSTRKSGLKVIRPLLRMEKKRIVNILDELGEAYCTDSTNAGDDYARNYLRNKIIPALEERINAKASSHIVQAAHALAEAEDFIRTERDRAIDELMQKGALSLPGRGDIGETHIDTDTLRNETGDADAGKKAWVSAAELEKLHPLLQKEIAREMVGRVAGKLKDITSAHIDEVLGLIFAQSGKSVSLPYSVTARNDFGRITLVKGDPAHAHASDDRRYGRIEYCIKTYDKDKTIPKNNCIKWFDYDKIVDSVEMRTLRDGDYIRLKKQGSDELGRKPVRDVLMELKVPATERDKLPLLASGSHVLWIGGSRGTDDFRVDEGTERILEAYITDWRDSDDKH